MFLRLRLSFLVHDYLWQQFGLGSGSRPFFTQKYGVLIYALKFIIKLTARRSAFRPARPRRLHPIAPSSLQAALPINTPYKVHILPPQASHCHAHGLACHTASNAHPTRIRPGPTLLGQHEGRRPAHVRAALRHRLRAEGPVAGRALLALLDDGGQAAVADEGVAAREAHLARRLLGPRR